MELFFLTGRILFGGYFLMNAMNHFRKTQMLADYAASKNTPMPREAVLFTGALLLIGGGGMLLGVFVPLAAFSIVLFMIPVGFMMHAFWKETDPMQRMMQMILFMRNMALAGAALMILGVPEPWPYSFWVI